MKKTQNPLDRFHELINKSSASTTSTRQQTPVDPVQLFRSLISQDPVQLFRSLISQDQGQQNERQYVANDMDSRYQDWLASEQRYSDIVNTYDRKDGGASIRAGSGGTYQSPEQLASSSTQLEHLKRLDAVQNRYRDLTMQNLKSDLQPDIAASYRNAVEEYVNKDRLQMQEYMKGQGESVGNQRDYFAQFNNEKEYNEYTYWQKIKDMTPDQLLEVIEQERLEPRDLPEKPKTNLNLNLSSGRGPVAFLPANNNLPASNLRMPPSLDNTRAVASGRPSNAEIDSWIGRRSYEEIEYPDPTEGMTKPEELTDYGQFVLNHYRGSTVTGLEEKMAFGQQRHYEIKKQIKTLGEEIEEAKKPANAVVSPNNRQLYQDKLLAQLKVIELNEQIAALQQQDSDLGKEMQALDIAARKMKLQQEYAPYLKEWDAAPENKKIEYIQKADELQYEADWSSKTPLQQAATWVGDRIKAGVLQMNQGFYGTADLVTDTFGLPRWVLSDVNKKDLADIQRTNEYQAKLTGEALGIAGDVLTSTVRTLPIVLMAMLSGGVSVGAEAAATLSTAGAGTTAKVAQATIDTLKSPTFLHSFMDIFGSNYTEEVDGKGEDITTAAVKSLWKASAGALIEVGGGFETASARPRIIKEIFHTALDEGLEEVQQGAWDASIDLLFGDEGISGIKPSDIVSISNEGAILSLERAGTEFAMGAAVGGILGGAQTGIAVGVDAVSNRLGLDQGAFSRQIDNSYDAIMQDAGMGFSPQQQMDLQYQGYLNKILGIEPTMIDDAPIQPTQAQVQEQQAKAAQMDAEADIEPRRAPERPMDPASERIAMPPVPENIEPRRAPERPADPAEERIEPRRAPERPADPAEERIEPRRAPERPLDPSSEAIAMPPVPEAIEPRKAPERPQDPATERIEQEPQTGAGYTSLAREYGMAGLRTSDLESVIGKDNLTEEVLQAHKEGVSQAKVEARMRAEEILGRREAASKRGYLKSISEQEATANGVNTIGKMSPAIRKASTALRVIAESTGINVVLFESPINDKGEHTGKQGWFDSGKRTVYLDVKAGYGNEEATLRAAGHELTHVIQKFAPEFYEDVYKPAVIDALYEGNEGTMLDLVQEQIRIAKENGKTMTESQAMFEVVADASERMLMGDQNTISGLVEQNPDLFKRVKNWIDNFVNSLRRAYMILKADSSAAKVLEGTYERFKGIQEMWWNGLQDAALNIRGQQEVMPISAYEQSRDAAREAKLQRIGTGLINPAMYEPVDYSKYKPLQEKDKPKLPEAVQPKPPVKQPTPKTIKAATGSKVVAPIDKLKGTPIKFRNLVKKWAANESINADLSNPHNSYAHGFVDWAIKWYNYGVEGKTFAGLTEPILKDINGNIYQEPNTYRYDDSDLTYPPFLQDTFFNQGKADAKKSIKPTKPAEAGGKPDVRGTEDHDTGGIPEVEERLPGQGQADEPSTGETVGTGPQAGGVLEEVSSEDVQQPGGPGGTARDSDGGIRPAVRDDVTTDAPGTTRGPGVGSGERGDLRNPIRDINDDVVQAATEAAKRRESEANKGKNYVIPPEGLNLPGGQKTRFNLNVEAIKIAKALEAEGRIATPEEQQALARYVGWGGIPDAFDARGRVKEGWEAENQTLKELLSEEEYDAARRSTTNAHYTEIGIIRSMYGALKKWGFKGGYVLEPSSGIGNFIGAAPSFGKQARWTAVELDSTTALIAKHLYPQANVHHAGFQDVQLPDNYFDLAISNVPFSETGPVDKKYPKFLRSNLHNYFFVKSMDKVRPGGLVMFITSRFTMDSANSSFREYMARHADLVGAVRLPDTAFKQNANTEVVTDLLVFKKRQLNTEYAGQPFSHAGLQIFDTPNSSYGARHNVNEYFLNNPDMVLGTPTISRGMYSANTLTYKAIEGQVLTEQLSEALSKINVKVDYMERTADPMKAADEVVKASSRTKNNGYEVKDGKVYQNNNGTLDLADDINQSPDKLARVTTMLGLRDLRKQLLHAQLQGKEKAETDRLRKELNKQYDAFVKKHGFLNSKENARLMYDDPDSFSLLALEDYRPAEDGKPEQAIKTDIFVKDTIASATRATSAKNPEEALAISINELGYLEPERMGELLSVTPDQAEALLLEQQLAFKDEDGALIPAPVYLSGRVRFKLIIAKQMAAVDKSYQANVEALESVIPADVPVEDISMPLGATWIPTEYYEGFIRHILDLAPYQGQVKVQMNPLTSSYKIELNSAAKRSIGRRADIKYGAGNWSFLKILDKIMNGGSMKATYKDQDGRAQTDKATTAAINEKAEQIKSEFVQWIKSDPDLAAPIARLYNDTFNDTVEATFDGENLTIDGANPSMPLKPHQKAVIQRALQSGGNMLIAHATGAGKTAEMAGIAMKMRQLGILKKPLFVVPKPVATQWGQEFLTFFPNAKVLVPQDADYEARNRKTYINKIISNDYDAVILSYEMFEAVPLSGEAMRSFYQAQIDEAMEALQAAKDDDTEGDRVYYSRGKNLNKDWTVKQIEKQLEKLQKRIEELDSKNKRDEDNVDFEELGVDGLFVDEAHNFKNLRVYTHLQNVAGINTSAESGRAFDLLAKVQHMQKLNGGKGVFFATATPVMNTLGELFVMQRYLMPDVMRDKGIYNFDAWVNAFASVMKELSINATGTGYKVKDTLSKFVNLPELQTMFRSFADVIPVVEGLKIPEVKGGKPFIHEIEPTEFQKEYVKELADRANNIKGRPEKGADNMLKITTEGRKVALSGRLVDVTQDIELDGKLAVTAKEIVRVYKESKKHKGTQLVFMDIGVPGANEALNMYAALKDMLVAAGIPSAQIKTIYDAKNEVGRKKLFRQVNDGTVRVLMGSTGKMGTGVNVQQRVAAMHHIDVPYRPGDLTQRNGRGQRQGNLYTDLDGIEIHYYVTKGTFDSYMWQKVQTKSAFIEQLMTNENKLRESEGESMNLTAAEVTAIASGNPMILEKFALENDLMKLAALKDQHDNDITHAKKQIHSNKTQIASLKKQIEAVKKDIAQKVDTKGDKFSMVVGNTAYKDRVKAGEALIAMYSKASKGTFPADGLKAGKLGGFEIVVQSQGAVQLQTNKGVVVLMNPESASGTIARLENALNFDGQVEGLEQMVSKAEADVAAYEEALEKPFERQEEYTQKKTRYDEIMSILAPNKNEGAETSDEEAADGFDGMESDERNLDYSFRRLASDDFLQEREDDPGRIEDRSILLSAIMGKNETSVPDSEGRALSSEQQEFFKDSKVRDEQGQLLTVYHGSPNEFTTFSRKYIGSNTGRLDHGVGFYFSSRKTGMLDGGASWYGDNITEAYLDSKNPLVLTDASTIDLLKIAAQLNPDKKLDGYALSEILNVYNDVISREFDVYDGTRANSKDIQVKYDGRSYTLRNYTGNIESNREEIAEYFTSSILGVSIPIRLGKYGLHSEVMENYDGVIYGNEYIVFSPEQIKSVDNLNPTTNPDIRYSDRDPSRLSNRERLVGALETVALNDYEKDIIKRYKDRLESITKDAELLKATNAQIRDLSFAPGPRDMDLLNKLKNNKQTLLNKIARQDARLLKIEAAQPLANLVNLEKRRAERALKQQRADLRREYKQEVQERVREVRQKGAEKLAKYKHNQAASEYRDRIKTLVLKMTERIISPSKNGYYPEALKGPLGDVLKSINEQSKRTLAGGDSTIADREFYDRLNKLQSVLSRINRSQQSSEIVSEEYSELAGFIDLPAGFIERMAELADVMEKHMKLNTGEYVLNTMTAEELKALLKMLTALDRSLETINKLHIQGLFAHVDQMGKYSIQHGDSMKSKLHREGKIDKFLNWDNTLPVYAFERMGKAGQSLFDGFRRGMDKQSKLAQEIVEFSETTFTPAEAREWGKQIITVTLNGHEVQLTAAHLMELYAHNRREQSRGHIYGAGIKVNNFKVGTTTYAHRGDVTLPSEITAAFEQLTDRQKEVALALQTFMSKRGGGLIDEVNMARFGAKQLDDENDTYWPIKPVPQNIDTKMEAPEGNPLYRILNMSFMKPLTKGANNQIVISNIFDTFASHMADVIQLNAFALPVLDAIKWFNYRQSYKNPETGQKYVSSVRSSIRNAFGEAGEKYVTRMLLDLNGSRMTGGGEEAAMTMLRHYNRSVVAANLRVALLQPTSIVRALNVIDARYLGMGALTNLAHLRRNIREMEKHSGIAIWKQLGFYDVNISRSIQDLIKRDNPLMDRLTDKTMVLPQTMDRITWAAIWDASKRQAAAENPGLNKNSEKYWDKVKALFDTAIYKTQVVDTMLTRSEYMRRPSFVAKWTSSFMSEPTMTYNILASQVHTFNDDVASGMSRGAAWRKNGRKITRTATVYALSVALVTMAEALSGAWRDDDEYMTFMEKLAKAYKNNLIDNLMPLNLPIINDLWQITKRFVGQTFGVDLWGFADASPLTQGVQLMFDGITAVTKELNGDGIKMISYGTGYKLLQGISFVSGHPYSSMTREVVDLWNNTAGTMYPEYKVKRYKQSINAGYKALFDALQGGDNERSQKIRDVLDRMGTDDKKVYSGLREQAREAYKEGKLDFDDAVSMLGAEQGSPDKGLYWTVKEWEARREADDWSTEFTYSRYDAYHEAIQTGINLKQLMQELIDNYGGDAKNARSTIASEITSYWKERYVELYKTSRAQATNLKARLMNAYALLGYDRAKKGKDIDAWLKDK